MYKLYLIMKLIFTSVSTSISNIVIELKIKSFVKSHNRAVKKAIEAYNTDLKKMTKLNSIRIRIRDKILDSKLLKEYVTIRFMDELENSIEESNKLIKIKHDKFLDFLNELFYRSKDAVNKYNKLVDKQKSVQCLFYRCKKIYMNEIIHSVKHSGR